MSVIRRRSGASFVTRRLFAGSPLPFINGWTVNTPELPQFKRTLSGATAGLALSQQSSVQPLVNGWTINTPELPQFKRMLPGATAGLALSQQSSVQPLVNGWTVNTPELPQPKLSNAAQTATGLSLPPQQVVKPFITGWTVNTPELPQFRRKQALPELTGRIDQTPFISIPPFGFPAVIPDLPQFRRKQAFPELTGRIDQPPFVPIPPLGFPAVIPDLPQFRFRNAAQTATGLSLAPQVIVKPLVTGWTVVNVDMPPLSNRQRFELPPINVFAIPPVLPPPPVLLACAVNQVVVAYSAVGVFASALGTIISADVARHRVGQLDIAYHQTAALMSVQVVRPAGNDTALYAGMSSDVARWTMALSELACTG